MVNPAAITETDPAQAISQGEMIINNAVDATYNISSMDQTYTIGHNKVRETYANMFQIKVQEANGATLLSKIQTTARNLSIPNHQNATYIVATEFNGRNPDGSAKKHSRQFFVPTVITRLNFNITEGGTNYDIEMVETSTLGYNYVSGVIKDQITVQARTVGDFVSEFERLANESIENAWEVDPNAVYHDVYEFGFDPSAEEWRDWRFEILDDPFEADGANFIGIPGGDPALQVIVNNGSNFSAVFGQVLQLTKEYKKIVRHNGGYFRPQPHDTTNQQLDAFPVFHKIITDVEFQRFDILRNDYQKKIKFKIKKFIAPGELIDGSAYISSITDTGVQNRRVQNYFGENLLRKRYDYYYTGKNTEVLELDLQFDYSYFYSMPYGDGFFGEPSVQTPNQFGDTSEVISRRNQLLNAKRSIVQTNRQARNSPTAITPRESGRVNDQYNQVVTGIEQELAEFYNQEGVNHPVRMYRDVTDDSDILTSDNNRRSGILKFGAVKMNLEASADLLQIELGIRGDPFWLGQPNSFHSTSRSNDVVDYEAGQPAFFLNVFFPTPNENDAGQRIPNPDYQVSAVYLVTNVISQYRNGQFVQYLSAVLDTATNYNNTKEQLENTSDSVTGTSSSFRNNQRNTAQEQEDALRRTVNNVR